MPNIDLSILNQRQTPAFYASSLATRPAFGFAGRIFIDTDSPSTGLYRDTGAAWVQIADPGAGTTGTLQQVTTNGNTTSQGITITAGGLSSNIVTVASNGLSSTANYIIQAMAGTDFWKIYGTGSTADQGEMVFQVGDNGQPYATGGERFRFNYDNSGGGTGAKDVFIVDYDLSYFNTSLGINTPTPGAAIDVHSSANIIGQLNQTTATNNSLLAFQNSGAGLWRIGNFYNGGANDLGIFDVIGNIQPVTVKKTTGQVLIGTSTVGSGKLVVASATGDNGIQIVGATAPSLRIDNAESGPTKRAGFGISTATNNFIQGSADRDFCMFNGSTTASPILFGIYDTTNVQEAARISASRNFLIGKTTDGGQRLQVQGEATASSFISVQNSSTIAGNAFYLLNNSTNKQWNIANIGSGVSGRSGNLEINNNAIDIFAITQTGNVGIGTTTPNSSSVLHLQSSISGGQNLRIQTTVAAGRNYLQFANGSGDMGYIAYGGADSKFYINNQLNDAMIFLTNGTESARISNAQNLLIGTTTDAGQKLQVNGETAFTNTGIQLNLVYSGATKTTFRCDSAGGLLVNASAGSYIINYIGGTERLRIKTNTINISNIPTSAAGLVSGDIYSNAGILTIVP